MARKQEPRNVRTLRWFVLWLPQRTSCALNPPFHDRRESVAYLKRFHAGDGLERESIDACFAGRRIPANDKGEFQLLQLILGAFALHRFRAPPSQPCGPARLGFPHHDARRAWLRTSNPFLIQMTSFPHLFPPGAHAYGFVLAHCRCGDLCDRSAFPVCFGGAWHAACGVDRRWELPWIVDTRSSSPSRAQNLASAISCCDGAVSFTRASATSTTRCLPPPSPGGKPAGACEEGPGAKTRSSAGAGRGEAREGRARGDRNPLSSTGVATGGDLCCSPTVQERCNVRKEAAWSSFLPPVPPNERVPLIRQR